MRLMHINCRGRPSARHHGRTGREWVLSVPENRTPDMQKAPPNEGRCQPECPASESYLGRLDQPISQRDGDYPICHQSVRSRRKIGPVKRPCDRPIDVYFQSLIASFSVPSRLAGQRRQTFQTSEFSVRLWFTQIWHFAGVNRENRRKQQHPKSETSPD